MQTYILVKSGPDPEHAEPIFASDDPAIVRALIAVIVSRLQLDESYDPEAAA